MIYATTVEICDSIVAFSKDYDYTHELIWTLTFFLHYATPKKAQANKHA